MTYLEGTLKRTLGLREEENDPVGEFLCIMGHYTSGPESHSATINQDEGPMGPLPARK